MEHHTLTVLDTHPVMLDVLTPEFSVVNDFAEGEQAMRRILESHPEPLFFVSDIRLMKVTLGEVVVAARMGSRGQDPIWQHPRIRSVYFVSESMIVRMVVDGLNKPAFGSIRAKVVSSLEEALADIERVMAES